MKKTAFVIMLITLLSKFMGFGRDLILSYFFGASGISDAYLVSLTIPSVIVGFIGVGIVTAYIPMQDKITCESGEAVGARFTSNLTNIVLLVVSILLFFSIIFAENIVKLFALGFSGETLKVAVEFTEITLFGMYFTVLISIYSGYLQLKNNYVVPALIGLPLNIIIMISIVLAADGKYIILAIGTLLAMAAQFFFMVPFIRKNNFNYSFEFNFRDDRIKQTIYIALPVIVGTSVNQLNILVDRTIASELAVGGISALNYANRLNLFVQGLFVNSIITVMYPKISTYANMKDFKGMKKTIQESLNIIAIFVLPITVGAIIFSKQIIVLLFGRGAFDANAINMTAISLYFYSIGMIGFGFREVLARGFYAMQDTKTPMINAAVGMFLNIILNIILAKYLGIGGLALATSIAAIFTTILLFISLRKKLGSFGSRQIITTLGKLLIASIIMGLISKSSYNYLLNFFTVNISLLLAMIVGVFVYFIILSAMKIEDVNTCISLFKKKFKINE